MNKYTLSSPSAGQALVTDYAAHLLSWQAPGGKDWIFLSKKSVFESGKAIRGGVPIIFPQFNQFGPGQRHGFARNLLWQKIDSESADSLNFQLQSSDHTKTLWPFEFEVTYTVSLIENGLTLQLAVTNKDTKAFDFTAAFHTYFALDDFSKAKLHGLKDNRFWDNDGSDFHTRSVEQNAHLTFSDAIDRVYFDVQNGVQLEDGSHTLLIETQGFEDVVVWNPGADGAKQMSDLDDNEYQNMLCVEAAVIDKPVTLQANQRWFGSQTLIAQQ